MAMNIVSHALNAVAAQIAGSKSQQPEKKPGSKAKAKSSTPADRGAIARQPGPQETGQKLDLEG